MDSNRRSFYIDDQGQWREGMRANQREQTPEKHRLSPLAPNRAARTMQSSSTVRVQTRAVAGTEELDTPVCGLHDSPSQVTRLAVTSRFPTYAFPHRRRMRSNAGKMMFYAKNFVQSHRATARGGELRVRDMAVMGLAALLAMGAVVLAIAHDISAQASQAQVSDRILPAWVRASKSAGDRGAVVINDAPLTTLARDSDSLVLPGFSSLMFEGGVFDSYQHAVTAATDYAHSKVASYPLQVGNVTTLLLGPTLNPARDLAFTRYLNQAEVPYFVRTFNTRQWTVPLPGIPALSAAHLEGLLTSDVQVLQGLLALHAGYAVPQLGTWSSEATQDDQLVLPLLGSRLGAMGGQIESFHEAVLRAEEDVLGQEAVGPERTMRQLTRAIALYLDIGRS